MTDHSTDDEILDLDFVEKHHTATTFARDVRCGSSGRMRTS
jgi:hypothetical protein